MKINFFLPSCHKGGGGAFTRTFNLPNLHALYGNPEAAGPFQIFSAAVYRVLADLASSRAVNSTKDNPSSDQNHRRLVGQLPLASSAYDTLLALETSHTPHVSTFSLLRASLPPFLLTIPSFSLVFAHCPRPTNCLQLVWLTGYDLVALYRFPVTHKFVGPATYTPLPPPCISYPKNPKLMRSLCLL